ncbi:MAG: D-2-hydroxyacid dehydrogenase [Bacteroidales bacterium]|nr:D-2-hydroxyacid dehydrogenase [Bacteroidales bacterium]
MKIVFLDASTMGDTSLAMIEELGELTCYATSTAEEALERVKDAEVIIINKVKVTRELIDAAPNLHLICEAATGVNNIDLDAAAEKGIPVRNVAGYSTDAVVQETFMHLLSLAGNAPYFDETVKSGAYSASPIFTDVTKPFVELAGKTMGIIGMGNIGTKVAQVAEAFGMKVVYFSTSGTSHCDKYPSLSIEDLMSESDVISIHAPLNERTNGLIGANELAYMKKSAFILNMGRGGIVDEKALADAISSERIAGAALDVFCKEPLPADSPLLHTAHPERLRFTPHTAWASAEARRRLADGIAENIRKGW